MGTTWTIFKRELKSYFESPVAYVFLVGFLVLSNALPYLISGLFERNEASLYMFFLWQPWVYLLLVPAATMGLWAEERRSGTIELLFTMPITMTQAIIGKFLAAWAFMTIAIGLTFPLIITTEYLGNPDMGTIISGYFGCVLMAGAYVSVGALTSSLTRNQVVGFVLSLLLCLIFALIGFDVFTSFFARWWPELAKAVAAFGFLPYFESLKRGVIRLEDIAYFASVMVFMIVTTHVVLQSRKSA